MSIADVTLLDLIEHEFEAAERERAWAELTRYWTACERAIDRYRKRGAAPTGRRPTRSCSAPRGPRPSSLGDNAVAKRSAPVARLDQ